MDTKDLHEKMRELYRSHLQKVIIVPIMQVRRPPGPPPIPEPAPKIIFIDYITPIHFDPAK